MSSYTTTNLGTGCLITGFAQKGEDLDTIKITNRSSWLLNFGEPTNEAEEYFYNAGMEVLNQGGFLHAAKIPYSNDIAGIYAASKYKITANKDLLRLDPEAGLYYYDELDENGDRKYADGDEDQPGAANGRFWKNYRSLKELGLNKLSLIAPAAQDFISKDLVEEYETGESKPGDNVIYLVDKTRAIYTRTPEIADKQENRDPRYCIGIVPVMTTMCNTAYFQRKSTGVESDVPELYQPVRSLKTISFPAGAASAAEYKATTFTKDDLHTQLMQDSSTFQTSLSENAATIAQSCLVNANLVDGKFKPYICNDVCVVVFKAFVSTEDGKVDFEAVETFVGSLDPNGRDEKGRTTFIDTKINNNSEYIYCFSNLTNPQEVLNPDHGFVVGSDSDYTTVKDELEGNREYMAATLFSAYAAKMLGFGNEDKPDSTVGLAAPRGDEFMWEVLENDSSNKLAEYAKDTMGALRQFYNQDAKQPVCVLDELVKGGKFDSDKMNELFYMIDKKDEDDQTSVDVLSRFVKGEELDPVKFGGYLSVSDKFITKLPSVKYLIKMEYTEETDPKTGKKHSKRTPEKDIKGKMQFGLIDPIEEEDFTVEGYDYGLTMGEYKPNDGQQAYKTPDISQYKLGELSILNSTDYLRAIYDFEQLVDPEDLWSQCLPGIPYEEDFEGENWARCRMMAIQALIINSMEKSGKFKTKLRYVKKAKIVLDKLDKFFVDSQDDKNKEAQKIGKKYIEDLYKAYNDTGLFSGIQFVESKETPSSSSQSPDSLLSKKDAIEAKLDEIINIDTTKKEKMKARVSNAENQAEVNEFLIKFLKLKIYLNSQYFNKVAELYSAIAKIMEDCAYAQQRYVETCRNTDDATIMLGFYPEMAQPIITYTTIAQSLNKIFEEMKDIHTSDIDVVCDAGISNIAQFVKQVYDPSADDGEDVGGLYEPVKYSSYFKFNKNTDLAYWKTIIYKFDTFCKFRGDCMFCTEGPRAMVLTGNKQVVRKTKKDTSIDLNILPYLSKIAGINTSYGAGYLNWYSTISDYTGDTLWVPPSIKAMGTYILTDKQYNWWDAPAGMRRGIINMVETSFNPNRVQAGEIYDVNWNYAIHYLNDGIIQEGQKTFQTRQSALDRINVRRLLGRIKRYVYFASRQFIYEPHTAATRERYVKTIKPFFDDLVTRGGLYDYKLICDESNNTPEVIDRNEMRVKIGIKPVKTIEWLLIDLAVLNTNAEWSEMDSI